VLRSRESSKFGFDRGKASVTAAHAGEVDDSPFGKLCQRDFSPEASVDGLSSDLGCAEDGDLL
jgi:hypothetical protein